MKKVQIMFGLSVILTLFALCGQAVLADTVSRDVPPSHPAYQAVKKLLDEGYLQLYQDQTFQGDKPVDRYTLAIIVARILDEIGSGKVGATNSDLELLRNLTKELHDELMVIGSKDENFEKKLDDLSRQNQVVREDLTNVQDKVNTLEAENNQLKQDLEQSRNENSVLRMKQQTQQTYLWVAIILAIVGIVH